MASNDQLRDFDTITRETLDYVTEVMDELSGGAFKRGHRIATALERVQEWDALTPDKFQLLSQSMGNEWLYKQGAEIERLRQTVTK